YFASTSCTAYLLIPAEYKIRVFESMPFDISPLSVNFSLVFERWERPRSRCASAFEAGHRPDSESPQYGSIGQIFRHLDTSYGCMSRISCTRSRNISAFLLV